MSWGVVGSFATGAGGALASNLLSDDSPSGSTSSTTSSEPWAEQSPYLSLLFEEAENLYKGYRPVVDYKRVVNPEWEAWRAKGGKVDYPSSMAGATLRELNGDPYYQYGGVMEPADVWIKKHDPEFADQLAEPERFIEEPVYGDQVGGKLEYYPKDTVARFTKAHTNALRAIQKRAKSGGILKQPAQEYVRDTLGGKWLDFESNPYINDMLGMATLQGDLSASKVGAYGSSDHQQTRANLAGSLLGNIYNQERTRMQNVLPYVTSFSNMDYTDLNALLGVGEAYTNQKQKKIDADKAQWDFEQMEPWQRLGLLQSSVGGQNWGKSTTTEDPYFQPSAFSNAIGGGLTGVGLADKMGLIGQGTTVQPEAPASFNMNPNSYGNLLSGGGGNPYGIDLYSSANYNPLGVDSFGMTNAGSYGFGGY